MSLRPHGPSRILPTSMTTPKTTQTAEPVEHVGGPSRHSYTKDRSQLLRRLSRMEGQVRGIARMVEREEYCIDILQQTAALRAAVDAVSLLLMEDHISGCLATAVKTGEAATYTEEVMEVVRRSMGRPVRSRAAD
jgi:DNA-binding FrmR family transcriptional regulator